VGISSTRERFLQRKQASLGHHASQTSGLFVQPLRIDTQQLLQRNCHALVEVSLRWSLRYAVMTVEMREWVAQVELAAD